MEKATIEIDGNEIIIRIKTKGVEHLNNDCYTNHNDADLNCMFRMITTYMAYMQIIWKDKPSVYESWIGSLRPLGVALSGFYMNQVPESQLTKEDKKRRENETPENYLEHQINGQKNTMKL